MIASIVVAVGLLASNAAAAAYKVHAAGLNCNFCAYTIERNISRIKGVEKKSIDIDVPTGTILVESKTGAFVDPARLRDAVTKGGYTYKGMEASIDGVFVQGEGRLVFQAEGAARPLRLLQAPKDARPGLKAVVHASIELDDKGEPSLKVMHLKPR